MAETSEWDATESPPLGILVADDRPDGSADLRRIAESLGEHPVFAASAAEAVRSAEQTALLLAWVSLDAREFEAFELVETLRRDPARTDLPVIFASAHAPSAEVARRIFEFRPADFVRVPLEPDLLRAKIGSLVSLRRGFTKARAYAQEVSRAAASKLHAEQERFHLLMEAVSDYALFFTDALGRVTEWTVSAERLLGYSEAEAVGRHIGFIFTPEDRARGAPAEEMERAIRTGQARDERDHLRGDGTRLPVTGRLVVLKDGTIRGFAKIMRDATPDLTLRESEAKFREIFETGNEGIWILNADSVIETANRRIAEMLGYEVAELVGRKKTDFVFPEDEAYIRDLFEERRAGKIQPAVEVRFRHKDGSAVWTLLSARPIHRDGKFAGTLDMFMDVSARRVAESRFRVFFESSAAGHALVDPATRRFLTVNRRFAEIVGRSPEELRGLTFSEITHPDDRPADIVRFADLFAGRISEVIAEKRYVRPDGTVVWVNLTTGLVRDAKGVPEAQISVVQDITARKQTELELADNRTRLRLAIEVADLGVFYYDGASGASIWSEQFKRLLDMKGDEPELMATLLARVHHEDRAVLSATAARIGQAKEQDYEWEIEFRVMRADRSTAWLKSNGVSQPRRAADGRAAFYVVGTLREITAQKKFEAELRKQIAERTQALDEKTQQLETFCYTVAHDLRAPLRAINGYADFALEDIATLGRPLTVGFLERIRESTHRLDALITDLLAYSRINQVPIHHERVELARAVETVLRELEPEIQRRHAQVTVRAPIPAALGEASIVEQILLNLVDNALKFSPPGEPPRVEIFAANGDGRVRLQVRDHGIGIAKEYHERIFKVFERLQSSRMYPGTGIGLAIVARGAERLGGGFGVNSEPGRGSTFWLELPRAIS